MQKVVEVQVLRCLILIVKVTWIVVAAAVLVSPLWQFDSELGWNQWFEVSLANFLYMNVLSFPLGLVSSFVPVVKPFMPGGDFFVEPVVTWITCTFIGYIQWFIIVPVVYRGLRHKFLAGKRIVLLEWYCLNALLAIIEIVLLYFLYILL